MITDALSFDAARFVARRAVNGRTRKIGADTAKVGYRDGIGHGPCSLGLLHPVDTVGCAGRARQQPRQ